MTDPGSAEPQLSLTQKSTRGLAWALSGSTAGKLISLIAQALLAWLLIEEDFGLVGLALTVSAFAGLIRDAGIREMLVQRGDKFDEWSPPAVWISLTFGVVASLAMVVVAPGIADFYESPRVEGLIRVLALGVLLQGPSIVPMARLASKLQFRTVTIIELVAAGGSSALSVLLALMGMGAYSFVVPIPIFAVLKSVVSWWIARPPVTMSPQFSKWRPLLGDSLTLVTSGLLATVWWQGDYIVLGRFHETAVVGIYYFAFRLSVQTFSLLAGQISSVLFPALSTITGNEERQTKAFLRAASVVVFVGSFLSLLQAAVAEPLINLVFADRWQPAVPVLQILSVGMAFRVIGSPAGSLFYAQGRFRTVLYLHALYAAVFMLLVTTAAQYGGAVSVAFAVSLFFAMHSLVQTYIGIRPGGAGMKDAARVFFPGLPVAALSAAFGWTVAWLVSPLVGSDLVRLVVTLLVSVPVYLALVRRMMPEVWKESVLRVRDLKVALGLAST